MRFWLSIPFYVVAGILVLPTYLLLTIAQMIEGE